MSGKKVAIGCAALGVIGGLLSILAVGAAGAGFYLYTYTGPLPWDEPASAVAPGTEVPTGDAAAEAPPEAAPEEPGDVVEAAEAEDPTVAGSEAGEAPAPEGSTEATPPPAPSVAKSRPKPPAPAPAPAPPPPPPAPEPPPVDEADVGDALKDFDPDGGRVEAPETTKKRKK